MKAHGFYERPLIPVLAMWAGHLALGLGGLAFLIWTDNLALKALGLAISAFGFIGIGAFGHSASHNSFGQSEKINRLMYFISYPVLVHLSATYWRYSHVMVHHPAPNVVGIDDDCDLRPLFGLNHEHLATLSAPFRRWPALQGLLLPLVLPLNGFNMMRHSWTFLFRQLRGKGRRKPEVWLDIACMLVNPILFLVLPSFFFPFSQVALVHALRIMLMGIGLFAVLAPGHFPEDAACLKADQRGAGDFYLRQGASTINFRTGPIGRFLCCGLEYQIEHHFFPSVSPVHYPALSRLVREFCLQTGIPYRTYGWGQAIWLSWRSFFYPKAVVDDVESLRQPVR